MSTLPMVVRGSTGRGSRSRASRHDAPIEIRIATLTRPTRSTPDRRASRGRPAAAERRRRDRLHASSLRRRGTGRRRDRLRGTGAAEPLGGRSAFPCGEPRGTRPWHRPTLVERARASRHGGRLRKAVRVHALAAAISFISGFRSCRTPGCPKRSSPTADACAQFRQCGQYAVMRCRSTRARDRRSRAAGGAPWLTAIAGSRHFTITAAGGVTAPHGLPFRRRCTAASKQGRTRSIWRSSPLTLRPLRPALHHQSGAGGAGARLEAASRASSRRRARDRRQQRLRERLHRARRGWRTPGAWPSEVARRARLPRRAGAGGIDRRHRRRAADGQGGQPAFSRGVSQRSRATRAATRRGRS